MPGTCLLRRGGPIVWAWQSRYAASRWRRTTAWPRPACSTKTTKTKLRLYAAAGIPEAWLVVLPAETIEAYTDPGPDGYRTVRRVRRGETLHPIMLPGVEITADEILG
ncbi:MAG: Uma2 family endonuclease [Gemmatimonadetes bacterium]|nr:Uma2 family endonuclease [Gemmatimonadota bacterium]MBI2403210.1 Uma2 family endonuclease [Gemmatimonadota bacterium]MBI2615948.1 Uma2 family endonuclease [Gemmatimonadota bacterium]